MSVGDVKTEPGTNLGLSLEYPDPFIQVTLNNNSGAGVNAAASLGATLVTPDPLTELVWSPHNGLSLKCAEGGLADEKPSLLWNIMPNNTVLSLPQSVTSREANDEIPIRELNLITPQAVVRDEYETGKTASSGHEDYTGQENQITADFLQLGTNLPEADGGRSEPFDKVMTNNVGGGIGEVANDIELLGLKVNLATENPIANECEAMDSGVPITERANRDKMKMKVSPSDSPQEEKLESSAENDLSPVYNTDECVETEERVRMDKCVPLRACPLNSRMVLRRRKCKEKALTDGDFNERTSKAGDESNGSVESCNSAGQTSAGKRRWSFKQPTGSKRVKKQIQGNMASTSFVGHDSSFMSWISNMMKGTMRPNHNKSPCLALSLTQRSQADDTRAQGISTCNKDRNLGNKGTGFQSIFQSLYCPNMKGKETRISNPDDPKEGPQELVLGDKVDDVNFIPKACIGKEDKLCKEFTMSVAETQKTYETNLVENKNSCNLLCGPAKVGVSSSNSSLGKWKNSSAENNSLDTPPGVKAIRDVNSKNDLLGSFWITRFSPKTCVRSVNLDQLDQSRREPECSAVCTKLISPIPNIIFTVDQKSSVAKELFTEEQSNVSSKEQHSVSLDTDALSILKRPYGHVEPKPLYDLTSNLPISEIKSPVAMASVFAKRLDALKHITPSGSNSNPASTCFFCGRNGHDLHGCSEVDKTEMEGLLRNMSSYDGAKEFLCLCIKCFQLDHWAISCTTGRQRMAGVVSSSANHCSASKMSEKKRSSDQVAGADTNLVNKKPQIRLDNNLDLKWNGILTSGERCSAPKGVASSFEEDVLKENQNTRLRTFTGQEISDVPRGMFEAVRRLRMSRLDVLKWLNSHTSLSPLVGFYLRLRVGKWEKGLGGTGYYVACITARVQGEKSAQGSKNPIAVNVGGIKCLVGSRYISNHDFLEEELMAWWSNTSRSGGKIPSEEDLKSKFEERHSLGF